MAKGGGGTTARLQAPARKASIEVSPEQGREFLANLQQQYLESQAEQKTNMLIYGESGAGKTHLLATAPRPLLIWSFDPGGTRLPVIQKGIADGSVAVDSQFEHEDDLRPTAFQAFQSELNRIEETGVLQHIKTLAVDSGTLLVWSMLNEIQKQEGISQLAARVQDYGTLNRWCKRVFKVLTDLPVNVLVTFHTRTEKDDDSGIVKTSLEVSGQQKTMLPMFFDEMLFLTSKKTPSGPVRVLRTVNDGRIHARTRIGSGIFQAEEEPDLTALLKKAGRLTPAE